MSRIPISGKSRSWISLQRRVLRTLDSGGSPFGVAIAKDGRLFVGDWNGSHVSVMDANGAAAATTVEVGRAPAHILLTADEKLLFVANRESDSVSVVRTADLAVVATIPWGTPHLRWPSLRMPSASTSGMSRAAPFR